MEEEEFLFKNSLFKDEEIDLSDTEEFLRPSKLLFEEESNDFLPLNKRNTNVVGPEIKIIEYNRKEPEEEELFKVSKLIYYDKELDNLSEKEDEDEDNYLFKPSELIYEDPLELFNKRREQGIVIKTPAKRVTNDFLFKKENTNIQTKQKSFLSSLKFGIEKQSLKKK